MQPQNMFLFIYVVFGKWFDVISDWWSNCYVVNASKLDNTDFTQFLVLTLNFHFGKYVQFYKA